MIIDDTALPDPSMVTKEEGRTQSVAVLDEVRRNYDAARTNRIRSMVWTRRWLSCAEIGTVLGITEDAVRKAIQKAERDPAWQQQ